MTSARPLAMFSMPRVTMNGGMPEPRDEDAVDEADQRRRSGSPADDADRDRQAHVRDEDAGHDRRTAS